MDSTETRVAYGYAIGHALQAARSDVVKAASRSAAEADAVTLGRLPVRNPAAPWLIVGYVETRNPWKGELE